MSLQVVVDDVDVTRRKRTIRYLVTPLVSYPTNGDVFNMLTATNPKNLPMAYPSSSYVPTTRDVRISSLQGNIMEFVPGATNALHKIQQWTSAGTEHANGVYTAGELADTFSVEVTIPLGK